MSEEGKSGRKENLNRFKRKHVSLSFIFPSLSLLSLSFSQHMALIIDRVFSFLIIILLSTLISTAPSSYPVCDFSISSEYGQQWTFCRISTGMCSNQVKIPGTALINLINAGEFANITDPFLDRILGQIPDISETGADFWTLLYKTSVSQMILKQHQLDCIGSGVVLNELHITLLLRGVNSMK
jgi:hypothetical protein